MFCHIEKNLLPVIFLDVSLSYMKCSVWLAGFTLRKECHLAYARGSGSRLSLLLEVRGLEWFTTEWTFARLL